MRFLTQPFMVTVAFTGKPGRSVELDATLAGCRAILDGEADDWAESSLYMVGDLEEARQQETGAKAESAVRLTVRTPLAIVVEPPMSRISAPRTRPAPLASCPAMPIS